MIWWNDFKSYKESDFCDGRVEVFEINRRQRSDGQRREVPEEHVQAAVQQGDVFPEGAPVLE